MKKHKLTADDVNPAIRLWMERAEPILRGRFTVNCCLNSTWVCLEVMRRFGLRAEPLSVNVMAMNARWVAKMQGRRDLPSEEEMQQWVGEGAWCLGIDTRPSEVAGQMSRPHRDIDLPFMMLTQASRRFRKGREALMLGGPKGAIVTYGARLDDISYQRQLGFESSPWNMEIANEIEKRMRA